MICSLFFTKYSDNETRSVRVAGNVTLFGEMRNTYMHTEGPHDL